MNFYTESRGRGPDLVMLHGWGLHGGVFDRLAANLGDDFCVHLPDLPGHGGSAAIAQFDPQAIAEALARQFPLPVHVLGWSLGGLVAQHWAALDDSNVKSLALVASSPRFVRDDSWPHAQQRQAIEGVAANLDSQFELTLERFLALQMMGAPAARDTLKALKGQLFAHGRPQGLLAGLDCLLQADARELAARIHCPVGLFYGAKDAITPAAAGRWLDAQLADSHYYDFPQASHAPFLSHEAEFIATLRQHLEQHA